MSKRVLIILGIGILLIAGAFLLHKKEVTDEAENNYPVEDYDGESKILADKPKRKTKVETDKIKTDEPIQEAAEAGTGNETA